MFSTHRWQLVPNRRTPPWARACRRRSHWRRCWTSHRHLRWSCRWASGHRAGFRARGSTTPSRRYRSAHRLVQRVRRYIHAVKKEKPVILDILKPKIHTHKSLHMNTQSIYTTYSVYIVSEFAFYYKYLCNKNIYTLKQKKNTIKYIFQICSPLS